MTRTGRLRVAAYPAGRPHQSNPFAKLFADALRAEGATVDDMRVSALFRSRYDIVHLHWPEWTLEAGSRRRVATLLSALAWARLRGARVVWTVHNLGHHDGSPAPRGAWAAFARLVDGVVCLTQNGVAAVRAEYPRLARAPTRVIPHGHYRDVYPNTVTRSEARAWLGIPEGARVALFFGQVRAYKGVVELLQAFEAIPDPNAVLVVAGRPSPDELAHEIETIATRDCRVRLRLGLVAVDDVQRFLNAADLVVLPYRESLNSGAALLALSFDRPVYAPARGAFAELAGTLGSNWVNTYAAPLDGPALSAALDASRKSDGAHAPLGELSWSAIGREACEFYEQLLSSNRRTRSTTSSGP